MLPVARTRYLNEDEQTAEARWRGCEQACWGRAFPGEVVEHIACPRDGAPLQPDPTFNNSGISGALLRLFRPLLE